ncbi:hypothetical protein M3Y99_01951200 [Aphelenchoides fujianensis]|nr:hypothetical protein M3Y99_01951200 [Aphelenchoides fujianensis]
MKKLLYFALVCTLAHFLRAEDGFLRKSEGGAPINAYFVPANILQNVRDFTVEPHLAGTEANRRVAEKIAASWKSSGLEDVHFTTYEMLLSYPDFDHPNHARILDESGSPNFETKGISPPLVPDEQSGANAGIQWLAYSGDGRASGDPVYAHFGRLEDFDRLEQLGVDVKGKIAIVRYGGAFRGDTVKIAKAKGVVGVILFSDPADVAPLGGDDAHTYPNTDYMPPHAVQRGAVKKGDGDPLTPFYPSRKDLFSSRTIEDLINDRVIPNIPALPLGYADVSRILDQLDGRPAPAEWQGGLNTTYRLGPGLLNGQKLELEVHSTMEKKEIQNVIGYIRGSEEPDRYVMLSNHFDAWVYGSLDPNSGTAILAEMARAMAEAKKDGVFKPRRSVMFCNWDAEEYGVMGSNEFAEEFATILSQRAVVLLNVDLIAGNGTLDLSTVPSMYQAVVEAAKTIETPTAAEKAAGRLTLYDSWFHRSPGDLLHHPTFPKMKAPNDGSDHATFLSFLGIPVADFTYLRHDDNPRTNRSYPLYHTLYETAFTNQLIDPDLSVHAATGKFWAELARRFTEQPVLPFNITIFSDVFANTFVAQLKADVQQLANGRPEVQLAVQQVEMLISNANDFVQESYTFQSKLNKLSGEDPPPPLKLRDANDRLMLVERCFVSPDGLPNFSIRRNVLFSFSSTNAYSGRTMPGVYDAMGAVQEAQTDDERSRAAQVLTEQVSHLQHGVQCATSAIRSDP